MGINIAHTPRNLRNVQPFSAKPTAATISNIFPSTPSSQKVDLTKGVSLGGARENAYNGWEAGFATNFKPENLTQDNQNGIMLNLSKNSGAEWRTDRGQNQTTGLGYGTYSARMKASGGNGVVNGFFLFGAGNGPSWKDQWKEIDIEFIEGNDGKTRMSVGYFDGHKKDRKVIDLPFDPTHEFHDYSFTWEPGMISWTVDGQKVAEMPTTLTPGNTPQPVALMANIWGHNADRTGEQPPFAGKYDIAQTNNHQFSIQNISTSSAP
jgi:beta-glucanase (GH16 family)